jgi:peptidoglycan hydrolase-like protein with peptidoglycan-binding domain
MKIKYLLTLPIIAVLIFSGTSSVRAQSYQFSQNLTIGSNGPDVIALQQILINKGYLTSISTPTGYFGSGTRTALEQLQVANGISPASGYCGAKTRAFLNTLNVSSVSRPTLAIGDQGSQPVTKSNNQICQNQYGANSVYSGANNSQGGLICGCESGYQWNSENTSCVAVPNLAQNTPTQPAPVPQSNYSASTLANNLAPQLAFITCDWYNRYGQVLFSQSSNGLLGPEGSNGNYFIDTVLGGVINTSYTGSVLAPSTCAISFPAGASLYAGGLSSFTVGSYTAGSYSSALSPVIAPETNVDFAQVNITAPNTYVADYAKKINYCSTRPSVGDSIAVFGWPINSTYQTLTGVITGTSGYYDTTNIGALPNGMQGSTAVSLTDGCVIGQINSSGEIADIQALSYVLGW